MKRYLLYLSLLSLFFSLPTHANTSIKTYILAGQSNANGYGLARGELFSGTLVPNQNLADLDRAELADTQTGAYLFKGGNDSGLGEWGNMAPGFAHWNGLRFGPELSFSQQFQNYTGAKVAIIKYSPDGTSLYTDWNPNLADINRYDYFIKTINNAKAAAVTQGWSLEISGVLWMQGESDSFGVDAPTAYEQNLGNFISRVRSDLNLPNLPFHIAQIADTPTWPARQTIWDAQASVTAMDSNAHLVNGKNLPLFTNDGVGLSNTHYTTEGTVLLGERFADSVVSTENIAAYPEPAADNVMTVKNRAITIDVIANDIGMDLSIIPGSLWSLRGGSVAITDNKINYTPSNNFIGEDKIWYVMTDSIGRTNSAEVTIEVVNSAPYPVAITEAIEVSANTPETFDVLGNDIGVGLSIIEVNNYSVKGGRITQTLGKLRYTPKANFTGNDSFWYAIKDYRGLTNAIKVTVTVAG